MNKVSLVLSIVLLFLTKIHAQETLLKSSFPVRDFFFENDSVFLIKKRHLEVLDENNEQKELHFIGGYGIRLFNLGESEILTVSNELRRDVSSVRFYKKKEETINEVFYYKEGNFLDFCLVSDERMFLFSTRKNKLVVVSYRNKPQFNIIKEVDLGSFSRKIFYEMGRIYCITDNGELYQYNLMDGELLLLYKTKEILTDFQLKDGIFYISNIKGEIIKYDSNTEIAHELLRLKDDFVTTSLIHKDNLIFGTWKGDVYQQSFDYSSSFRKKKVHGKAIYRILSHEGYFYSCSLDKTFKKWKI